MELIHKRRLLHLAALLEAFEDTKECAVKEINKFDLEHWTCGTAACAVGFAALHPAFIQEGFTLDWTREHDPRPSFENYVSWEAVRRFFGIRAGEARYLFSAAAYHCPRPRDVADRIQKFAITKGKENGFC